MMYSETLIPQSTEKVKYEVFSKDDQEILVEYIKRPGLGHQYTITVFFIVHPPKFRRDLNFPLVFEEYFEDGYCFDFLNMKQGTFICMEVGATHSIHPDKCSRLSTSKDSQIYILVESLIKKGYYPTKRLCKKLHSYNKHWDWKNIYRREE